MRRLETLPVRLSIAVGTLLLLVFFTSIPLSKVAATNGPQSLTVGLYPYVPRLAQFEAAIRAQWAQVEPGVTLNFLPQDRWDGGYSDNPPQNADVYVFDGMFFEYFRAQGWLEPMAASEIQNLGDFIDYAITGVEVGTQYYAIPLLGCANILFYQKSDAALANATTLSEVHNALSQCTYTSEIPPDRRGIMVDLAGGTSNAAMYLDTEHAITGVYPLPLPWNQSQIDPNAMANVQLLLMMASFWNGTTDLPDQYGRAAWFNQGYGRAYVGFTESMSELSAGMRSQIGFKVMPLANAANRPLFYADVIGVNTSTTTRGTRALAVKLANLMAASDTVVASIGSDSANPYPQYLMATRPSVFQTLGQQFPIYNDMYALTQSNPIMFALNAQARQWLDTMKNTIRSDVRQGYPCGCDFPSSEPILDNADAYSKCAPTCQAHGGWNGQWTNAPPAPGSVCGCNICPVGASASVADPTPRPHY
jgi:thiamine pyridinylase